jgi:hypothetical protein
MANEGTAVDLRFPIGKADRKPVLTPEERRVRIEQIAETPGRLSVAVAGLSAAQLDTPYREGGWTVRQVVHHLADSHMNSFVRFKLALTEKEPTIKPYEQDLWAGLADSALPIEISLSLLTALHQRWVVLLHNMKPADFARTLRHPEQGLVTLDQNLCIYAWHGRHHVAHVTALRERKGWN